MCSILNLVADYGLYIIVSQFWIKLIELKVNNYTLISSQNYVFYVFEFMIEIFSDHEYDVVTLKR